MYWWPTSSTTVWSALNDAGLANANLDLVSDIIACPGLDYCALANARAISVATNIGDRFAAKIPMKLVHGIAAAIFGPLAEAGVNVDMIVQASAKAEGRQNMVFTCPDRDAAHAKAVLDKLNGKVGIESMTVDRDVAKVSVIGVGMRSHAGVAKTMFQALSAKGINIQVISTSEIKISVLIDASYTELAVRALHTAYGLDSD